MKPAISGSSMFGQGFDLSGEWVIVEKPNFRKFEKALDDFSREARAESWAAMLLLPSSRPSGPWNERQTAMFAEAVRQAPRALAEAPYGTVRNLILLRDLAAEQDKLGDAFWEPFGKACDLLSLANS